MCVTMYLQNSIQKGEKIVFSDNLIYLRKKHDLTQEQLAEELEVSRQAVSKWETGDGFPETDKIIILCEKFGVTMDALMRGDVTEADSAIEESEAESRPVQSPQHSKGNKRKVFLDAIDSAIWVLAVAAYLIMGFVWGLWHPGWIVFIVATAAEQITWAAKTGASFRSHCGGAIGGAVFLLSVAIYLLIGCVWGLWHPGWIIFLVAIAVMSIVGAVFRRK